MKTITLFIGVSMLASVSFAQISSTSQFSGTLSDNFESYPDYATSGSVITLGVMGGGATFSSTGHNLWVYDTGTAPWGLGTHGAGLTTSGTQALGINNEGSPIVADLVFVNEVSRFGGSMATSSNGNNGIMNVSFFDVNNVQIGNAQSVGHGSNAMNWYGWESTVGIKRIRFVGNSAPVMDDIQANSGVVPEPASIAVLGLGALALIRRRRSSK